MARPTGEDAEAGSTVKERMRKHGSTNGRGFLDPQEDA
jgi:hypothetical protein